MEHFPQSEIDEAKRRARELQNRTKPQTEKEDKNLDLIINVAEAVSNLLIPDEDKKRIFFEIMFSLLKTGSDKKLVLPLLFYLF